MGLAECLWHITMPTALKLSMEVRTHPLGELADTSNMFDERKTAQMAAFFLAKGDGSMSHLKLMKLLYLAERESLVRFGIQMTGDRLVSMDQGPVLSETLNHMDDEVESVEDGWMSWISSKANYELSLIKDARKMRLNRLSRNDIEILNDVWRGFGHLGKWEIRDFTHTLPEWSHPHGSCKPINRAVIFASSGRDFDAVKAAMESLEEDEAILRALA